MGFRPAGQLTLVGLLQGVGGGPVALDTTAFIYWIEDHPQYARLLEPLFTAIDAGDVPAVTSALTLLETLVVPIRNGDRPLAERYQSILTGSRGLACIDISREILRDAGQLRASKRIRTPDALQLATALRAGATALVTNDASFPAVPRMAVLHLRAYV